MTVGFAILAHDRPDRVSALAAHLALGGAPVSVHVDARGPDAQTFADTSVGDIHVSSMRAVEWGRFSMIEATWDAVNPLLDRDITHVCLISGACLPIRPLAELQGFLAARPTQDFIEAVPTSNDDWVVDGLSEERFSLIHPFSHRDTPWLFSRSVDIQRALRIRRRMPPGLQPHLGSQWWCLTARTLRQLREHPNRPRWDRFFRRVWIPDEAYFQTLVPHIRPDATPSILPRIGAFDPRGKPYVFHDDHLPLLAGNDAFLARKIDPDAGRIYAHFLGDALEVPPPCAPPPCAPPPCAPPLADRIAAAGLAEQVEGTGTLSQSRYPGGTTQTAVETACPYLVIMSDDADLLGSAQSHLAQTHLARTGALAAHGLIFAPGPPGLAVGDDHLWGNLPARAPLRDYRPAQYLAQVIRGDAMRGARTAFAFVPEYKMPDVLPKRVAAALPAGGQIAGDGNARIVVLGDPKDLLGRIKKQMPFRRRTRRPPKQRELWAWHCVMNAEALRRDLIGENGLGKAVRRLEEIATSDWTDDTGWVVPEGWKPPRGST